MEEGRGIEPPCQTCHRVQTGLPTVQRYLPNKHNNRRIIVFFVGRERIEHSLPQTPVLQTGCRTTCVRPKMVGEARFELTAFGSEPNVLPLTLFPSSTGRSRTYQAHLIRMRWATSPPYQVGRGDKNRTCIPRSQTVCYTISLHPSTRSRIRTCDRMGVNHLPCHLATRVSPSLPKSCGSSRIRTEGNQLAKLVCDTAA